jgi:hypothetical protein
MAAEKRPARAVLDSVERECRRRGVSYRRERATLYLSLPDRELKLRPGRGRGLIQAEAWIGEALESTVVMTEERARALVRRLADT